MLIKHSMYYLFSIGIPGLINLFALSIYTRILSPETYGRYAIAIACVGLSGAFLFQWLKLGVLRFFTQYQDRKNVFLSTVLLGYALLVVISGFLCLIGLEFIKESNVEKIIIFGLILLWVQSFFELNQELARIQLNPKRYGCFSATKAIVGLMLGGGLAYLGYGVIGLLVGLITGMLLPLFWVVIQEWKIVRFRYVEWGIFRHLLVYGLPLTANFALGFVVRSSDRFLLGWFLHAKAAGLYSVGYDLANQSIGMLLMIINLAAYPLAVRALEQGGKICADKQLSENGTILLAIAIPTTVGFALLSPNIAEIFLGHSFSSAAANLMPWVALATLLAGLKAYYFDISFQLSRNTMKQIWAVLIAAIVNVLLNIWWIPVIGIMGAAYSTVIAYAVGLVCSILIGRQVYVLPWPRKGIFKVVVATVGMVLILLPVRHYHGNWALAGQVSLGMAAFGLVIALLDFEGVRSKLMLKVYGAGRLR